MNATRFAASVLLAGLASRCCGQQVAQVVQLPTFSFFSVSTTVSVPDSGSGFLGGVQRAQYGSITRGAPLVSKVPGLGGLAKTRSIGSSVGSSTASVSATIIDHSEYDRRLLAEAAARRGAPRVLSDTDRKAAYLSSHVARRSAAADSTRQAAEPAGTPRAPRLSLEQAAQQLEAKMEAYLARARRAASAGRYGAARCSYDVVLRRGNRQQRLAAQAGLAVLDAMRKPARLAAHED